MAQGRALLFGLLIGLVVGCASEKPVHATAWRSRGPLQELAGPDVVRLVVALVERPFDDAYLGRDVWLMADEQNLPVERKSLLEENGFRIGHIGGLKPAALQTLLSSERSCVNPRQLFVHSGRSAPLALGPTAAVLHCQLHLDGDTAAATLQQATCLLQVVPGLGKAGEVRLQFTPQVQHGEAALTAQRAEDDSGFLLQSERPTQAYPSLAWEVSLLPNQYLIIGACVDRPETLGYHCFLRRDETVPVQRLLVVRASWADMSSDADPVLMPEEDTTFVRVPSLALQANGTKTGGTAP